MDEKLRRWLENHCRARPDGTWLVEVPMLETPVVGRSAPNFALPDARTKEEYLARATGLGRTLLATTPLIAVWGFAPPALLSSLVGFDLATGRAHMFTALLWCALLFVLCWLIPGTSALRLRRWLEGVGSDVGALEARQADGAREPRAPATWWGELLRFRPGRMVAVEVAVLAASSACVALGAIAGRVRCREALEPFKDAKLSFAEWASLCPDPPGWGTILVPAILALVHLNWWDWWRSNRGRRA